MNAAGTGPCIGAAGQAAGGATAGPSALVASRGGRGRLVEPEPEPGRLDGAGEGWARQAPLTLGGGQVECWADAETPIFDEDVLLALFD